MQRFARGRPPRPRESEEPVDPIAQRQGARLRLLHAEKERREEQRITQDEIGAAIGTSAGAYGHYERGRVRIPIELLPALSRYYDVSPLYLLGLSDEPGLQAGYSDEARLVCDIVNQMSPETQQLMVTWAMDQLKVDRQRTRTRDA